MGATRPGRHDARRVLGWALLLLWGCTNKTTREVTDGPRLVDIDEPTPIAWTGRPAVIEPRPTQSALSSPAVATPQVEAWPRRAWSPVATLALSTPRRARGLVFEAQTDGTDIELVLINRTTQRQWWCGPGSLLSWVRVDVVDDAGTVLAGVVAPSKPHEATSDGYTWSVGPGDALWLGTVAIKPDGPNQVRATLADGRSTEIPSEARLQLRADPPLDTQSSHADCLRWARTRWYAASGFRTDLPWGPPDAPPHRVFPALVAEFDEINAPSVSASVYSFRFRDKGREGTMR